MTEVAATPITELPLGGRTRVRRTRAATKPVTTEDRVAWDQQPGENDLWFSRFAYFVALGPKRSVSLLTKGRRNAYPVPAHWPMVAKQRSWRERAKAFDEAAKMDPALIPMFNEVLRSLPSIAVTDLDAIVLARATKDAGYAVPVLDEDEGELASASSV